jgi:hypothetical protein
MPVFRERLPQYHHKWGIAGQIDDVVKTLSTGLIDPEVFNLNYSAAPSSDGDASN